jgi:hypothetical protein
MHLNILVAVKKRRQCAVPGIRAGLNLLFHFMDDIFICFFGKFPSNRRFPDSESIVLAYWSSHQFGVHRRLMYSSSIFTAVKTEKLLVKHFTSDLLKFRTAAVSQIPIILGAMEM